jgi:hypothetical protein
MKRKKLVNKSHKQLLKALSIVFNKYICLRDSDGDTFVCCDCGGVYPVSECDAGHLLPKSTHKALEFNERNVHAQWNKHNRNKGYNRATVEKIKVGYSNFMFKKYGLNIIDELESENRKIKQLKSYQIVALIQDYKRRISELD